VSVLGSSWGRVALYFAAFVAVLAGLATDALSRSQGDDVTLRRTATIQLLLTAPKDDEPESLRHVTDGLAARAEIYAAMLPSEAVRRVLLQTADLSPRYPVVLQALALGGGRSRRERAAAAAVAIEELPPSRPVVVAVTNRGSPLILLTARAESTALARRLGDAAASALERHVESLDVPGVEVDSRVTLRPTGAPVSTIEAEPRQDRRPYFVGLATMLVLSAFIFVIGGRLRRRPLATA
jgi:hypothetical protein